MSVNRLSVTLSDAQHLCWRNFKKINDKLDPQRGRSWTPFVMVTDLLEEAGIIVNKNLIPFDKKSPMECSGIRPGTPALTTRGMKEPEMETIGTMFSKVLSNPHDNHIRAQVRQEVKSLCGKFPIYEDLELWQ